MSQADFMSATTKFLRGMLLPGRYMALFRNIVNLASRGQEQLAIIRYRWSRTKVSLGNHTSEAVALLKAYKNCKSATLS